MSFGLADDTKKLLALFLAADYGTTLTYPEITERTGLDAAGKDRQRVYSVLRVLERDHRRTLQCVRGVGYKVANPAEHVESMSIRRARAGTQIEKANRTGKATNIALLSDVELTSLSDALVWCSRVEQALTQHDTRLGRIEAKLGIVHETVDGEVEHE
jgi:hypothetical protein